MKRLIIVFASLFICACTTQSSLVDSGKVRVGMSKEQINDLNLFTNQFSHPFSVTAKRKYYRTEKVEIISPADGSIAYVFRYVGTPSNPSTFGVHAGTGVLWSTHETFDQAINFVERQTGKAQQNKTARANTTATTRNTINSSQISSANRSSSAPPVVAIQSKSNQAPLKPAPSVSSFREKFLEEKKPESFNDLYYLCDGKTLMLGELEGNESIREEFLESSAESLKTVAKFEYRHTENADFNKSEQDNFIEYLAGQSAAYAAQDLTYLRSLLPPESVRNNEPLCIRTGCLDNFSAFLDKIKKEANECIDFARWWSN